MSPEQEKLIARVPLRINAEGVWVPNSEYREVWKKLNYYSYSERELEFLSQELDSIEAKLEKRKLERGER